MEEMDNRCERETMSEGLLLIVMALLLEDKTYKHRRGEGIRV